MEKMIKEILKSAVIKTYFDEELKGKHFRNKATRQILEATGYVSENDVMKNYQLIFSYTLNHQALKTYLADFLLEETKEPLTKLPNMK